MALLGICVVALVIGALRLLTERTPLPAGSSYSAQPDGALALYTWVDALGGRTLRLQDLFLDESQPINLVVVVAPLVSKFKSFSLAWDPVPATGNFGAVFS